MTQTLLTQADGPWGSFYFKNKLEEGGGGENKRKKKGGGDLDIRTGTDGLFLTCEVGMNGRAYVGEGGDGVSPKMR